MPPNDTRSIDAAASPLAPELRLGQTMLEAGGALPRRDEHDAAVTRLVRELHAIDAEFVEAMQAAERATQRRVRRIRGSIRYYIASVAGLELTATDQTAVLDALRHGSRTYDVDAAARHEQRVGACSTAANGTRG